MKSVSGHSADYTSVLTKDISLEREGWMNRQIEKKTVNMKCGLVKFPLLQVTLS